jgi:hypothetical protein
MHTDGQKHRLKSKRRETPLKSSDKISPCPTIRRLSRTQIPHSEESRENVNDFYSKQNFVFFSIVVKQVKTWREESLWVVLER